MEITPQLPTATATATPTNGKCTRNHSTKTGVFSRFSPQVMSRLGFLHWYMPVLFVSVAAARDVIAPTPETITWNSNASHRHMHTTVDTSIQFQQAR